METTTLRKWDTEYTADCVEFCPIAPFHSLLAVGTYQLVKESGHRVGKLYLLSIKENSFKNLQEIEGSGILDLKWSSRKVDGEVVLGLVRSNGDAELYVLKGNKLKLWKTINVSAGLALYLDFNTRISTDSPQISVSDSLGKVSVVSIGNDPDIAETITAHQMEAWVTNFNYWDTHILYTGADDSLLKGFDLRCPSRPIFINKSHDSGVTYILPINQSVMATGSYDENIRIFDCRQMKTPMTRVLIGGGVWRIRPHPTNPRFMMSACMYEGFKLLELTPDYKDVIVKGTYTEHSSIAYGVDWCPAESEQQMVASVSFYDHLLCVWNASF